MAFSSVFSTSWFAENDTAPIVWTTTDLKMTVLVRSPVIDEEEGGTGYLSVSTLPELLAAPGWQAADNTASGICSDLTASTAAIAGITQVSTIQGFQYEGAPVIMTALAISVEGTEDLLMVLEPSSPTYLSGESTYLKNSDDGYLFSYVTSPETAGEYSPALGSIGLSSSGLPWEDSLIAHVWVSPQRVNYAVNPSFESATSVAPSVAPFGWRSNTDMTVETGGVTLSMGGRDKCVKLSGLVGDNIVLESLPIPNQRISPWWSLEAAVSGVGEVRIGMLFWPPHMEEGSATYVTTSWVRINTPVASGFIPIKALIPNVETYREAQFRLEFQGEGDIFVDNVLVDPNEAQLGYFDGDWEMGMSGDYSWYGDNDPAAHDSYSLYYNNRSSISSYLFSPLGDGDNPPNHHVRSWVPEGASVNIHWDHLHAGTSPSWGDTVYMPILDFAVKDEVATVASTSITSPADGSLIPEPEET